MRRSLKVKLAVVFSAIIILVLVALFAANTLLLDKIYLHNKKETLVTTYKYINNLYQTQSTQIALELERIYSTDNITIAIKNSDNCVLYSSVAPPPDKAETKPPEKPGEARNGAGLGKKRRNDFSGNNLRDSVLETGEGYEIRREDDDRLLSTFIYLIGELDNGNSLTLRIPFASIAEAATTGNKLLIMIGFISLLIGVLFVMIAARTITKPISELSKIAQSMSQLDFSRKYEGKGNDEIARLGSSINEMSSKLESTIAKLRETNAQLEADIDIINKTDIMRKEFIANASHELKTPVALVSGYAEGLRDNIASSQADKEFYCNVIVDEAGKMEKIIRQFLDIMELDYGEKQLNITHFDIRKTIDKAIRNCSLLWQKKGVEPHFDAPQEILIDADEWKISQAVTNYLTNAINHTDGVIEITVGESECGVRIGVYNSGKTIPPEEGENIWESFYKLDKARTRAYGGTGLGLSIVKSIVNMHGGEYGFENKDAGVEFYLIIKKLRG